MVTTTNGATGGGAGTLAVPRLMQLSQLLGEWEADAQTAFDARVNGVARGPVTGLVKLDAVLGGLLAPGLHIVHGSAGVGKTAFALQAATSCGCPALYVTCEMRPLELFRRITARVTDTFLGRLKSGELAPADSPELALADATQVFADVAWLRTAAEAARGPARHLLLVVDSLHSWSEGASDALTEYDALNAAIAALRTLAGALECPVLAIAERNRMSMKTGGLSASAGSRKFEYGAETVIGLAAEQGKTAPPPAQGEESVVLSVEKNRSGAAGKHVDLYFHGALQRFREA
jgi:replicative DNA helicase